LPTPTIGATTATQAGKYFNPVLFNKSSLPATITGVGFQPDFTWWKARNLAQSNILFDTLRGPSSFLISNSTAAQDTQTDAWVTNSDGWTSSSGSFAATYDYVAWNWKANGSGSTNTAGSITSTVSANTTSGFSVVTYTGTGSAATVGHGLGVAPSMIIYKSRNAAGSWVVGHVSIPTPWTTVCYLDSSSAASNTGTSAFNSTAPTSTVFSIGAGFNPNGQTMVAYCFAEVAGYSKFGSYTGNGSSTDGPFVYTGFKPAYVLLKRTTDSSADYVWWVMDSKRGPYNATAGLLKPNSSDAENSAALVDFLSNGFKVRNGSGSVNANGVVYIYAAFAETPTKFSLAR
jgi:hypothetical protein